MTRPDIWFVGDPHGDFRLITRYALQARPDAVIFLGDLELPAPLEEVMYPLLKSGIAVRGIHGNHDADMPDLWRRVADGPLADVFNLDGRVETIAGVRIAGLGGVFRGKIWYPPEDPTHNSYAAMDQALVPHWWTAEQRAQKAEWAEHQRLTHRGSIFPDVYERLAALEADVLVSHEAPGGEGMHRYGFEAIGDLAELLGCTMAFHGHHHENRFYPTKQGVQWVSVGLRQIVDLNGDTVLPGERD